MPRIAPGTEVTWASQAAGSWKVKTGKVVAFLPARTDLFTICPEVQRAPKSRIKGQACSFEPRYVVAVPRESGYGVDYYTPHADALERQTQRIQTS